MEAQNKYYKDIFLAEYLPSLNFLPDNDENNQHEKYDQAPDFVLDFAKVLGPKRRCYCSYLNNKAIALINELGRDMEQAVSEQEKKGIVRQVMRSVALGIRHQVTQAGLHGYEPAHYEPGGVYNGRCDANDAFIVLYGIHRMLCIYLEVQERHLQYVPPDDVMTIDEAYQYFCNHLCRKHVVRVVPEGAPLAEKPVLIPCKGDLRPPPRGVLTYEALVKNPEKFALAEQELYVSHLIDHQHMFQNKRGAQTTLAMIVAHLYRLGYFNNKVIPGLRPVRLIDVIRFVEHRYQVSLYRLVRNAVADPRGLDRFVKMHRWLELLPGGK